MPDGWKWIAVSLAVFVVIVILGREQQKSMYENKAARHEREHGYGQRSMAEWLHAWFYPIAFVIGALIVWLVLKWKR